MPAEGEHFCSQMHIYFTIRQMLPTPAVKSSHTPFPAYQPALLPHRPAFPFVAASDAQSSLLISSLVYPPRTAAQLALTSWDFHQLTLCAGCCPNSSLAEGAAAADVAGEKSLRWKPPSPRGHTRPLQTARSALRVWLVVTEHLKGHELPKE